MEELHSALQGPEGAGVIELVRSLIERVVLQLGPRRMKLLESVVVRDVSWLELGPRAALLRQDGHGGLAVEAIAALGDWNAGRSVAAPPVLRYRNQPGSL